MVDEGGPHLEAGTEEDNPSPKAQIEAEDEDSEKEEEEKPAKDDKKGIELSESTTVVEILIALFKDMFNVYNFWSENKETLYDKKAERDHEGTKLTFGNEMSETFLSGAEKLLDKAEEGLTSVGHGTLGKDSPAVETMTTMFSHVRNRGESLAKHVAPVVGEAATKVSEITAKAKHALGK
jgi:hypothetical protein